MAAARTSRMIPWAREISCSAIWIEALRASARWTASGKVMRSGCARAAAAQSSRAAARFRSAFMLPFDAPSPAWAQACSVRLSDASCSAGRRNRSRSEYSAGTRKRVNTVETVSPPMTARASGRFVSLPSPMPSAIGTRPTMVAMVVMRIGRSRVRPASTVASIRSLPRSRSTLAKSTSRTPFETTMPTIMMIPMKLFTESVVPVSQSMRNTPEMPSGTLNMITKGSSSERNWEASTMYTSATAIRAASPSPRNAPRCRLPGELRVERLGRAKVVEHLLHRRAGAAQVLAGGDVGGHVDDALQVFAADQHRAARALDAGQRSERDHSALGRGDEHLAEVVDVRAEAVVHAHVDEVLVAGGRIGERRGRELGAAGKGGEHALRHLRLGEAERAGLLAVHHHVQLGVVLLARDLHVGEHRAAVLAGQLPHARGDLGGVARAGLQVVAEDLHVDGRRGPEVEDALHDAAGEEVELGPGEGVADGGPQLLGGLHVAERTAALGHQVDL